VHLQVVVHDIRDGLRVRGAAGSAAVDAVVDVRQLVGDTIRLYADFSIRINQSHATRTMYEPMVVRESAPTTTPPSNWTAMIDVYVCARQHPTIQYQNIH
jgi:hypothetical protein